MEVLSAQVRDLVLEQPPIQLLGYTVAQLHMGVLASARDAEDAHRPNKDVIKNFQFALEYLHAVWSCHTPLASEKTPFDEPKASELLEVLAKLQDKAMFYCMASSETKTEFHARSSWTL